MNKQEIEMTKVAKDKALMKATLQVADEVRAMNGGRIPEMTPARKAQLEQNVVNKIMGGGDLTKGTKAERLAEIDRALFMSEHTQNAALLNLRKAFQEERKRVEKLKD
jgi:hypothetical protein